MTTAAVLGPDNKEVKKITLNKAIFAAPVRRQLLFDCVQGYLTNRRQGTVKAKTRSEVRGSTRKIYRQKGTGNARHGDIKAPIFVGGGVVFPPLPRAWRHHLSQKTRKQGLISVLSLRKKEGNLIVVDSIPCKEIKTKPLAEQLRKWGIEKGILVIEEPNEKLWRSARNIANIAVVTADLLNVLDVMKYGKVVMTEKAYAKLEARLS